MVLFEMHQRFKGHFLNELRVSFKILQLPTAIYRWLKKQNRKLPFIIICLKRNIVSTTSQIFATVICHRNLLGLFAVVIHCGDLQREFAAISLKPHMQKIFSQLYCMRRVPGDPSQFCSNCGSPGTRTKLEQIHNFL